VEVLYDDRGVPHVFAKTEEDAWRAQGYLIARDRLFQLELQARASAGTLSQLLGDRALEADRFTRRRGLPWAAERIAAATDSNRLISRAARAYAEGINAWIGGMRGADLPLEYRLLNARPFHWEARYTYYFFNQMALTWPIRMRRSPLRVRGLIGAAHEALFPVRNPVVEPIQRTAPARRLRFCPPDDGAGCTG
jgi:penicillin amidase